MADVTADLTNDLSQFEEVLFQRGKIIVDGELNDLGRLTRVRDYRLMRMATNNSGQHNVKHGRVMALNIEIVPGDDPGTVVVRARDGLVGLISMRGHVFELSAPVTLSGITENPPALEEYQVYVKFTEVEISSVEDPSIKIAQLQETTRRIKLIAQVLLSDVDADSASEDCTNTELYENSLAVKAGLLALVRREPGVDPVVEPYQIHTQYIPVPEFDLFRVTHTVLCRSQTQVPSTAEWNGVDAILTITNTALVVLGTWADEGSAPLRIELPETVELPNKGDALVIHVPPYRRSATPGFDNTHALASLTPGMYSLKAAVENVGDYTDGHVNITGAEDSFSGRVVVCVRISDSEVLFRNNRMVRSSSLIESNPGEGLVTIADDQLMLEHHEKGDQASYTQDRIPYTHSRYVGLSDYNLIHAYREQDLNGSQVFIRMYLSKSGLGAGYTLTRNAKWLPQVDPVWQADDATTSSFIVRFGHYTALDSDNVQIQFGQKRGADVTWIDSEWDLTGDGSKNALYHFAASADGLVELPDAVSSRVTGIREVRFTGTSDPVSPGAYSSPNTVGAALTCKAWGHLRAVAGGITVLDSFGITSAVFFGSYIRVTLTHAMFNPFYSVSTDGGSASHINTSHVVESATQFLLKATSAIGGAINLSDVGNDNYITFQVFGRQ